MTDDRIEKLLNNLELINMCRLAPDLHTETRGPLDPTFAYPIFRYHFESLNTFPLDSWLNYW